MPSSEPLLARPQRADRSGDAVDGRPGPILDEARLGVLSPKAQPRRRRMALKIMPHDTREVFAATQHWTEPHQRFPDRPEALLGYDEAALVLSRGSRR